MKGIRQKLGMKLVSFFYCAIYMLTKFMKLFLELFTVLQEEKFHLSPYILPYNKFRFCSSHAKGD